MLRLWMLLLFTYMGLSWAQFPPEIVSQMAQGLEIAEASVTDLSRKTPESSLLSFGNNRMRSYRGDSGHPVPSAFQYDGMDVGRCGFCLTGLKLGENGTIQSPNFPNPYPDNEQCLWLLETDLEYRIKLECDTVHLQTCGPLSYDSPQWKDYLIISPLWTFKKSYVYCGHATTMKSLRHVSICNRMAISFRSDKNGGQFQGFHCVYTVVE